VFVEIFYLFPPEFLHIERIIAVCTCSATVSFSLSLCHFQCYLRWLTPDGWDNCKDKDFPIFKLVRCFRLSVENL